MSCLLVVATSFVGSGCESSRQNAPLPPKEAPPEPEFRTRVVVVGSGTPVPNPLRGGPATAVVIDEEILLFDTGAGVLRGLAGAGLSPTEVEHVFVTHLHSDHTLGLDEMVFGGWTAGREHALQVYGPPEIGAMLTHLEAAFSVDRAMRIEGLEGAGLEGAGVETHVIEPGPVYRDGEIEVSAFRVQHGSFEHAFGFRVQGPDRLVVISGDTAPTEALVDACDGCDVLVHEVYSAAGWRRGPSGFRAYHAAFHTSGWQLGQLAARARPRLLVLTHLLFFGQSPSSLLEEIRTGIDGVGFEGEVVIAEDGESY